MKSVDYSQGYRDGFTDATKLPAEDLKGTFPVVLYLPTEKDRDELIEAIKQANPNLTARPLK